MGKGTSSAYTRIRQGIPFIEHDTVMSDYLEKARILINSGQIVETTNTAIE